MAKRTTTKFPTQELLGILVGSLAGGMVSKFADKIPGVKNLPDPVKKGLPVIGGLVLTMTMKKNALIKNIGVGMIAKGTTDIVAPVLGIGAPEELDSSIFMGESDDMLSLPADQSILSGYDEDGISEADEMALFGSSEEE